MTHTHKKDIFLLYDGECYICQQFSTYIELRKKFNVHIQNAREELDLIHVLQHQGYNINQGMLLITHEGIFVGEEAAQHLDYLIIGSNWYEKIMISLSKYKYISTPLYKIGKCIRKIIFYLQGKKDLYKFK